MDWVDLLTYIGWWVVLMLAAVVLEAMVLRPLRVRRELRRAARSLRKEAKDAERRGHPTIADSLNEAADEIENL